MTGTLIRIALRNLLAHKVKTTVVGGILILGTIMLLLGVSALTSMDRAMSQSLTASISGHLQVSMADAKDKFVLFPSLIDGTEIGEVSDFPKVRKALESLPQVEAVIPQGFDYGMVFGGNLMDVKLAKLRKTHDDIAKPGGQGAYIATRDHVRRIVELLSEDLKNLEAITDEKSRGQETVQGINDVRHAAQPEFWRDFDAQFDARLNFLENKVAVMAIGEDFLFIRYMGTDTARFRKHFHRFEMLEGKPTPPGKRGIMLNHFAYEEFFKHKTARRLDKMKERIEEGYTIADDDQLQDWQRKNVKQYKEIIWQLDAPSAAKVRAVLIEAVGDQKAPDLGSATPHPTSATQAEAAAKAKPAVADKVPQTQEQKVRAEMVRLVSTFFDMNDTSFSDRYALFYKEIAPRIRLYRAKIGDVLTVRGEGAGGYAKSTNMKIYGVFQFRGLEKSILAGAVNIIDMMSFRDLYGFMTADKVKELAEMQKAVGVKDIARDEAEDAFFGGGDDEPSTNDEAGTDDALLGEAAGDAVDPANAATAAVAGAGKTGDAGFDEFADVDMKQGAQRWSDSLLNRVYTEKEIDTGVVRNAAIILAPGADEDDTKAAIEQRVKADKLGVQVLNWRKASGMLGDFVSVIYIVLLVAILGVFGVALFIINNSMVLATIERTREIGTLRAIGMQRRHVLWMFIVESLVLGIVFGVVGSLVGGAIVQWVGSVGIPSGGNTTVIFLFGGPRLFPTLAAWHVGIAMVMVALVTTASTVYPALLATRVTPLEAMQEAEG
ncbi:MAG: FtsX-like permease family protein [Myxococcales bacterium]|nr:FtsX-like permease family protein [Myxococcales bacterium]